MIEKLSEHLRITGLQVTNEDVDSRKSAIKSLKASWNKIGKTPDIIAKAAEVAEALGGEGFPPLAFGEEIQGVVQKHASAFLYTERPLEVGVLAGITAASIVVEAGSDHSGVLTADVWAASLWLALGFQPSLEDGKREVLRREIMTIAQSRSIERAETTRRRTEVSDFGEVTYAPETNVPETFKKATAATIAALRRNAALDREELDFLWWLQLNRSRLFKKALADLEEPVRLIVAGVEAAKHLRGLPCDAHREVLLRWSNSDSSFDLVEIVDAFGDEREILGGSYVNSLVAKVPRVFPLLHTLATGSTAMNGAKVKRTAAEWGARALLEAALLKLQTTGLPKL